MRRLMRALRGLSYLSTDQWQAECVSCSSRWTTDRVPDECPHCGCQTLAVEWIGA